LTEEHEDKGAVARAWTSESELKERLKLRKGKRPLTYDEVTKRERWKEARKVTKVKTMSAQAPFKDEKAEQADQKKLGDY